MGNILITGIRATGIPHIGNYIGSIKPVVALQEKYQIYQLVADLHAISHVKDSELLRQNVRIITACYIASGLDYNKSVIWRQSHIPESALITLILSNFALTNELDSMLDPANISNVGMISYLYPVLMAADTLMIRADYVFGGIDNFTGLKYIQYLSERFNESFGNILKIPEPIHPSVPNMVTGLDGRKMSKSLNNTISILETEDILFEKIMYKHDSSKMDEKETILNLIKHFSIEDEYNQIESVLDSEKVDIKELKYHLFRLMNQEFMPIRERFQEIISVPKLIDELLEDGSSKVYRQASVMIQQILEYVGFKSAEYSNP